MLSSQRLWPRSWSCCVGFILVSFLQEWNLFQISLEAQGKPAHMPDLQWRQTRQMHPIRDSSFSNVHPHAYTVTPLSIFSPESCRIESVWAVKIGGLLSSLQILPRGCRRHSFLLCSTSRANLSPWPEGQQCSRWATLRPSNVFRASLD